MNTKIAAAASISRMISHILALWLALVASAGAQARWQSAQWADLPGWGEDAAEQLWPQLRQQCTRPRPPWQAWCRELPPAPVDRLQAHAWLMATLRPFRVGSEAPGLLTGYFEPELAASRQPSERFQVPLLRPDGRPLLYLDDAVDAMLLQVQGSGRVRLVEADGREQLRRVAWAGDNRQPFRSMARWLVEQGALREGQASWSAVRAWLVHHPERLAELRAANPRVVYFREEPLPDPDTGPRGAMGWPLTPERSVAVDPRAVPHGTLLWLDSTRPAPGGKGGEPLRRLVLAQDSGSAIVGPVRADFFWGWGEEAFAQAGRTQQPLRWWALWPKEAPTP